LFIRGYGLFGLEVENITKNNVFVIKPVSIDIN